MKNAAILKQCLKEHFLSGKPYKNSFFTKNWFYKYGKSYSFIFKQNLFVTNIQYRELIELIRINTSKNGQRVELNFMSTQDYDKFVNGLLDSFVNEKDIIECSNDQAVLSKLDKTINIICSNYSDIFENTIIVDAFYTSCKVSLPVSLEINLLNICFQAGYIHSCGENVYLRNIQKATYNDFVETLCGYLSHCLKPEKLILYTHEEYPIKNKQFINNFEKNGLDDIKFYQQKYYMQDMSLLELKTRLNNDSKLTDKLILTEKSSIQNKNESECIWMIIDRSIGKDIKYPGLEKYYICYKQLYINENPFHIFDEEKPGWINHVTIPHTLIGAMINIGKSAYISNKDTLTIIDPFVGSGTSYLESLKYSDVKFFGGDICSISHFLAKINIKFFSLTSDELNKLSRFVLLYIKNLNNDKYDGIFKKNSVEAKEFATHKRILMNLELELSKSDLFFVDESAFCDNFANVLNTLTQQITPLISGKTGLYIDQSNLQFICAIWILMVWKTFKRNEYAFMNNNELKLNDESFDEFLAFYFRLVSFLCTRKRSDNPVPEKNTERMLCYYGKYTKACSIDYAIFNDTVMVKDSIQSGKDVIDFLEQFENNKVDIIITDPPYGFNTFEEKESFSKLYIEFINAMVKSIKNKGQIIMCLPAYSYSGKEVNAFAQKEIVGRQFKMAADKNNLQLINTEEFLPNPQELYSFPFYWDSEKALRRDIIRFQFNSANSENSEKSN